MSKRSERLVYIGEIINYLLYFLYPFPRGLNISVEGSSTFLPLTLSMHMNRLGLLSHLYGCLFSCITIYQGSWADTTAIHIEIGWCCTVAVSACCSAHQLPGYECAVKRSCAPLGHLKAIYMSIYSYMQPYIHAFEFMYKF